MSTNGVELAEHRVLALAEHRAQSPSSAVGCAGVALPGRGEGGGGGFTWGFTFGIYLGFFPEGGWDRSPQVLKIWCCKRGSQDS